MTSSSSKSEFDASRYTADQLVDDFGWFWFSLRDEMEDFKAAWWVIQNAGTEDLDYSYRSYNQWLFRDPKIATAFKLMFG